MTTDKPRLEATPDRLRILGAAIVVSRCGWQVARSRMPPLHELRAGHRLHSR